jgi:putative ABC transport system permease protein
MLKVTIRGLLAHKVRFALTGLAIVLGVAGIVGSFMIRDGLDRTFGVLVGVLYEGVDAEVIAQREFDEGVEGEELPFDQSVLDVVRAVDGVAEAIPVVVGQGFPPVGPDGDAVVPFGPPVLSFNFEESDLSPTVISEGRAPEAPGEFTIDRHTAADEGFEVGQTYDVITATGPEPFTLVGLEEFRGAGSDLAGAVITSFTLEEAQRVTGLEGQLTSISVSAAEGVSQAQLTEQLNEVLPEGTTARTQESLIAEQEDEFGEFTGIFGNVLLGFALVMLFVATFIINNTFNIVIGQRIREMALLRTLGASNRQVRRAILLESLLLGLLASIVGILAGAAIALGLRELFIALGFDLPSFDLIFAPRTIFLALLFGVGATFLSALLPARKAAKIPPIAALRDDVFTFGTSGSRTVVIGGVVLAVGVVLLGWGLFFTPEEAFPIILSLAGGALGIFIGVYLLSPLVAGPVASVLGRPLRFLPWLGTAGQLARRNAVRNPRRTSATAGALMIGLALIATATVVGQSLTTSITNALSSSVQADYFVYSSSGVPFTAELGQRMADNPDLSAVSAFRGGDMRVDGDTKSFLAADFLVLDQLIDLDVQDGAFGAGSDGTAALHSDPAEDLDVGVGDTIPVTFPDGTSQDVTVSAIFEDTTVLGANWLLDLSLYDEHFTVDKDFFVAARLAEGVDPATMQPFIDQLAADFQQVEVQDQAEFLDAQEAQVDSLLAIVNGLLLLAILIALIGITNTLALSVFERTREIGLLRAVGMVRRQTRSMIRWEAAVVAVFGALLGVGVGVLFGWAVVNALPDAVISQLDVPWGTLVLYIVIAGVAGLVAAIFPAIRASRLNVLDAISYE